MRICAACAGGQLRDEAASRQRDLQQPVAILAGRLAQAFVQAEGEAAHDVDVEAAAAASPVDGDREVEQSGQRDRVLGEGPRVQVDAGTLGPQVAGAGAVDPDEGPAGPLGEVGRAWERESGCYVVWILVG